MEYQVAAIVAISQRLRGHVNFLIDVSLIPEAGKEGFQYGIVITGDKRFFSFTLSEVEVLAGVDAAFPWLDSG